MNAPGNKLARRTTMIALLSAIAAALAAIQATANDKEETVTVGDIVFGTIDWTVTGTDGSVSTLSNEQETSVRMSWPSPYQGSKANALKSLARAVYPNARLTEWVIEETTSAHGYDVLYVEHPPKKSTFLSPVLTLAVFHEGKISVMALSAARLGTAEEAIADFSSLFSVMQFGEEKTKRARRKRTDKLDGFYAAITPTPASSANDKNVVAGLWLKPNGQYAKTNKGKTGNFETFCKENYLSCGRYEIADGKFTSWQTATPLQAALKLERKTVQDFAMRSAQFTLDENLFVEIYPLDGLRLDGDFQTQSTDANSPDRIGFLRDGRLFEGGIRARSRQVENQRGNRTGRYTIEEFALEISYDDGTEDKRSIFIIDDTPVIDGQLYERQ